MLYWTATEHRLGRPPVDIRSCLPGWANNLFLRHRSVPAEYEISSGCRITANFNHYADVSGIVNPLSREGPNVRIFSLSVVFSLRPRPLSHTCFSLAAFLNGRGKFPLRRLGGKPSFDSRREGTVVKTKHMPTFDSLMNPLLDALFSLGGSGSIDEIYEKVLELENIDDEVSSVPHNPEKSNQTEVGYRLAWARTYLKKYGFLENSSRGIWALTTLAKKLKNVDPQAVVKEVREGDKATLKKRQKKDKNEQIELADNDTPEAQSWKEELYHLLTKEILPDAFERLTQRLLRESGFVQVEVTGRTGDGGIDGKGIAKIHGFMSFHVIFQCKKYQGSVSASDIRDFRGAMVGRADKGLFITTGTFTSAAVKEATRDGAPPIDLVDGEQLAEKLKELQLGLKTEMIEKVTIEKEWFKNL